MPESGEHLLGAQEFLDRELAALAPKELVVELDLVRPLWEVLDRLTHGRVRRVLRLVGDAGRVGVARRPCTDDGLLELVKVGAHERQGGCAIDVSRLQVGIEVWSCARLGDQVGPLDHGPCQRWQSGRPSGRHARLASQGRDLGSPIRMHSRSGLLIFSACATAPPRWASPRPREAEQMENSQGSKPCTGGVPVDGSKLERSLHRDRSTRTAPAVAVGLIEVGLVQDRVVVVRPVLPDDRQYAARPPGPKGSGAREADEAPPCRSRQALTAPWAVSPP